MSARACRRLFCLAFSAVFVSTLISGCRIPSRPLWWPKPRSSARASSVGADSRSQDRIPVVAKAWHPGMRQLGVDIYWVNSPNDSDETVRAKARRIIDYAISLNANSIAVSFPVYTHGLNSDTIYAKGDGTPSPARIAIFLAEAARSHIRVTLRPLLNEAVLIAQDPKAWRGVIEPTNRSAWFKSYVKLLLPYAAVAASGHAATFVIGTELESLEGDPRWAGLIHAIRSVYRGELLYDETYNEFQIHDINLPVSTFGVDAYPRFQLSDNATVGQLASAWKAWLGTHTRTVRRRAILSEIGIAAVSGAYRNPGNWLGTKDDQIVPVIQKKWYKAVCRAVSAEDMGGIYWWEASFDANPANPYPYQGDRITFLARPAQQEVK